MYVTYYEEWSAYIIALAPLRIRLPAPPSPAPLSCILGVSSQPRSTRAEPGTQTAGNPCDGVLIKQFPVRRSTVAGSRQGSCLQGQAITTFVYGSQLIICADGLDAGRGEYRL